MKRGIILIAICVPVLSFLFITGPLFSAECRNDKWQPTFVRHMSVAPTVFYYTGETFVPMSSYTEAQRTCFRDGVRMRVKRSTCKERKWEDFSCGCNINPAPNKTCEAFHKFLKNYENNALGRVWEEEEAQKKGVWTRRGASNTFDAVWTVPGKDQELAELQIHIKGNVVTVVRRQQRGNCTCNGMLASDMKLVTGTCECPWLPEPVPWQATIQR